MARAEVVMGALGAPQEPAQTAPLAQRRQLGVASREDLPRVALVPHVPDDAVARRVEDVQQRDRELDHAEPRADVAAGLGDDVDEPLPHFGSEHGELLRGEPLDVFGTADGIEQGHQFGRVTM